MILSFQLWVTFLALVFPGSANSQVKVYDILLNGMDIGELKVYTTTTRNGEIHYIANADASIWFFGRKNITTLFKSIYRDKSLAESTFHEMLNEKTQSISKINWDGSCYRININDERSALTDQKVTYSTAILYHKEPKNISELFSERYGKFCPIKAVAPNRYELTMPDGKKNYYNYVNGVCDEVEVHSNLYRFRFKLRQ